MNHSASQSLIQHDLHNKYQNISCAPLGATFGTDDQCRFYGFVSLCWDVAKKNSIRCFILDTAEHSLLFVGARYLYNNMFDRYGSKR